MSIVYFIYCESSIKRSADIDSCNRAVADGHIAQCFSSITNLPKEKSHRSLSAPDHKVVSQSRSKRADSQPLAPVLFVEEHRGR